MTFFVYMKVSMEIHHQVTNIMEKIKERKQSNGRTLLLLFIGAQIQAPIIDQ